ncbi:MAG: cryptochrome/photolyase family protein [Alphaproteobacteria bacterium]
MAKPTLRVVLGDQLTRSLSSLRDARPGDVVLMAEVAAEATYVRHHVKKIALVFSAMRHFARALEADGIRVDYVRLDDPDNSGSLRGEAARAVKRHGAARIVVTEPGEFRLRADMDGWEEACGVPVEIREDSRFVCSHAQFRNWAEGRKTLRMEYFYREMRKRTGLLMEPDGKPRGGKWNYDTENREPLPAGKSAPECPPVRPDRITRAVLDLVRARFGDHFGELEPFGFAVTAADVGRQFEDFLEHRLACFGDYQDAMRTGEPVLYHALISIYLNIGLLDPLDVCRRVEAACEAGRAPLNAAEGFIRQILGWREYMRGVYWLKMPEFAQTNYLGARRRMPQFYWTGETDMNCVSEVVRQTSRHAYAHHIQRLMVTGLFALLAGLDPQDVNEWYMVVFADAYEWVELPNTHGMALFADGGVVASKPYAASGAYINRMSDYCRSCAYDVRRKEGEKACPFNYLYWDFLIRNRARLEGNPRLAMPYKTLRRMTDAKRRRIGEDSAAFLRKIGRG